MNSCYRKFSLLLSGMLLAGLLAACNSSSAVVEKDAATQSAVNESTTNTDGEIAAESVEKTELAKVINKPGKVKNRGTYIKILVNKSPITNFDIQRRAKFLQLRRAKGNRNKLAEEELIEQAVKIQEARARNALASDEMVNTAFANFAKQNRISTAQMARELGKAGVGANHFKEFIRGQISWQRMVQARFQAETSQTSERDIVTQLRKSGSAKPEVTEYNIKQIIFVIPENKRSKSTLNLRRKEAVAFRQQYSGCENTIQQAKLLKDVSVIDRKRLMEPELPERWKDAIINVEGNGTTRVKETSKGIELMAICSKRVVNDDRAAQLTNQSAEFADFNQKGSQLSQEYLEQLMKQSVIIYQ